MSNKLFVGNLSFNTTENDLQDAFAAHGFGGLFEREENSARRLLIVHVAESRQGGIATSPRFTPPPCSLNSPEPSFSVDFHVAALVK
jgi:hypothetical protein